MKNKTILLVTFCLVVIFGALFIPDISTHPINPGLIANVDTLSAHDRAWLMNRRAISDSSARNWERQLGQKDSTKEKVVRENIFMYRTFARVADSMLKANSKPTIR